MRKIALAIAALLLATSAAHAEIKIGAVLSVTGPASFLGEPEKKTLEMYVKALNAAGGVNGEQITTIIYDDGGDASKARTFATRLVEEDKVDAVLGGSATGWEPGSFWGNWAEIEYGLGRTRRVGCREFFSGLFDGDFG